MRIPNGFIVLTTKEGEPMRKQVAHIVNYWHDITHGAPVVQDVCDANGADGYACTIVTETPEQVDALIMAAQVLPSVSNFLCDRVIENLQRLSRVRGLHGMQATTNEDLQALRNTIRAALTTTGATP